MNRCSHCYYEFDQVHLLDKTVTTIQPGMISICSRCGQVYKANEDSELVLMDKEEIDQLVHDQPDSYMLILSAVTYIMGRVQMN